ncbi:MAG: sugar transferase [Gemmatimonadetes bacterium]|nr:sugar transferase [Gemmatimonadota bacterium]
MLRAAEVHQQLGDTIRRSWGDIGRRTLRVTLLLIVDLVVSGSVALLALSAFPQLGWSPHLAGNQIWALAIFAAVVQALVLAASGAYTLLHTRPGLGRILAAVLVVAALGWLHGYLFSQSAIELPNGATLLGYVPAAALLLFGGRVVIDHALSYGYRHGVGQRRVLVLGSAKETAHVMRAIHVHGEADVRMVGRLSLPRAAAAPLDVIFRELEPALRSSGASEVIIAASSLSFEKFEVLVHRCFEMGVSVSVATHTLHRIDARLELTKTRVGEVFRLHPGGLGLPKPVVKRSMDVLLSVFALLLFLPLLVLIAAAVKLDSRGPAIFRQLRTGAGGRPFWMYKFRTMVDNADQIKAEYHHLNESTDPRLFKIRNDPRVTRVGLFLRRTSLDELPQLINVLLGEMSLIGPRPFFPDDLQHYAEHHFERLTVLPGITGLWQVRGRSSVLDFEEVIRLDRQYIHEWSVLLDLKIMALTVPAVLRRTGAY